MPWSGSTMPSLGGDDPMLRGWILVAAVIAAPAAAADQFDLICKAKKTEVRYRVDLSRGEWCSEDCRRVLPVANVTTGELTLEDVRPTRRDDPTSLIRINRSTGQWHTFFAIGSLMPSGHDGLCEPAPFSGFPATKF